MASASNSGTSSMTVFPAPSTTATLSWKIVPSCQDMLPLPPKFDRLFSKKKSHWIPHSSTWAFVSEALRVQIAVDATRVASGAHGYAKRVAVASPRGATAILKAGRSKTDLETGAGGPWTRGKHYHQKELGRRSPLMRFSASKPGAVGNLPAAAFVRL